MRKQAAVLGTLMCCFIGGSVGAASVDDLSYEIVGGVAVTITDCDESAIGELIIPDYIEGLPVTIIGSKAFRYCRDLERVEFPSGCEEIGVHAFYGCGLTGRIEIPQGIKRIGSGAFFLAPNVTEFLVPESVTYIGDSAFRRCIQLSAIIVNPMNVAYSSQDGILFNIDKTVLLQYPPARVAETYSVPAGVSTLGNFAFYESSNLKQVSLPNSVSTLKRGVFSSCPTLEAILVSSENPFLTVLDKVLFDKEMTIVYRSLPFNAIGPYALPASVETVWDGAFSGCSGMTEIMLPEGLVTIRIDAFMACSGLTHIEFPDSLLNIGGFAFRYCRFSELVLPPRLESLGNYAFGSCSAIENVRVPASVSHIGSYAFQYCRALNSMIFEGDAPSFVGSKILQYATGSTLYFYEGATGFTTPTWLDEEYPCTMLSVPADSFRAWASENGIDSSGLSVAEFFSASGSNGIAHAFLYAYGENLLPEDELLKLFVENGIVYLETPQQLSATTNGAQLSLVTTTNLVEYGDWTLSFLGEGVVDPDRPHRVRYEVLEQQTDDTKFFRLKAELQP